MTIQGGSVVQIRKHIELQEPQYCTDPCFWLDPHKNNYGSLRMRIHPFVDAQRFITFGSRSETFSRISSQISKLWLKRE